MENSNTSEEMMHLITYQLTQSSLYSLCTLHNYKVTFLHSRLCQLCPQLVTTRKFLMGPEMMSGQRHTVHRWPAVHKAAWQGKHCPEARQANGPTESPNLAAFLPHTQRADGSRKGRSRWHRGRVGEDMVRDKSRKLIGSGSSKDNRNRKRNKQNFKSSKSH